MQKAHLYEAIFLFNHGMDEAVRGLERLKCAPDLDAATVDRTRVLFEGERADMNTHFCNNIEGAESSDASNFDKRVREIEKETLDAVKVYEDVQFIEERRRKDISSCRKHIYTKQSSCSITAWTKLCAASNG